MKYTNDKTVSKELGESYFTCLNETIKEEGDYIVMPYSASDDVAINSNDVGHVRVYSDTQRISDQEISPRIFKIDDDVLTFDPISFENIKANYYQTFFNMLSRVRIVDCECNLSKLDVIKWEQTQLVNIDYFDTSFIVLDINNFIPNRPTKVKLLAYGR